MINFKWRDKMKDGIGSGTEIKECVVCKRETKDYLIQNNNNIPCCFDCMNKHLKFCNPMQE